MSITVIVNAIFIANVTVIVIVIVNVTVIVIVIAVVTISVVLVVVLLGVVELFPWSVFVMVVCCLLLLLFVGLLFVVFPMNRALAQTSTDQRPISVPATTDLHVTLYEGQSRAAQVFNAWLPGISYL